VTQENLSFLLSNFELKRVEVPAMVGGVQRDEQGKTVCKTTVTQTATEIKYEESSSEYKYEYRGGVEAKVEVAESDATRTDLDPLRRQVLDARPSPDTVAWQVA
jgi:hypothetical protein